MARLSASTVALSPDFDKILVAEWEVARKLDGETWTQDPSNTSTYYLSFTDGEVHKVEINGAALTEKSTAAGCNGAVSTFWMDTANKLLYVHTSGSDSPAATGPKYCVLAYFYIGLANDGVTLMRYRELLTDGKLDVWTSATVPTYWGNTIVGTAAVARNTANTYDDLSCYSAKLTVGAIDSSIKIFQYVKIKAATPCFIRLKYKCVGTTTLKLQFTNALADANWLKSDGTWATEATTITIPNATAWTEYSISFTSHPTETYYRLWLLATDNADECYVDNVELKRYYEPMFFMPYLGSGAVPSIRHSVGTFRDSAEQLSLGTLSVVDDGYFATNYPRFIWDNKTIRVYVGAAGCTYDDLAIMFTGITRRPTLRDGTFSVEITDSRSEYRNLLQQTFDPATYANCEDSWKGKPVPILFGDVHGFQPPQQDTANRVYRLSQTAFGGANNHAVAAVTAVYLAGNALAGANWANDDANGTITITGGNAEDIITCDATGYTSNHEYWAYRMLTEIQGIPDDSINLRSFSGLGIQRGLTLSRWYSTQTNVRDAIDTLKTSAQYFFFSRADGEYFGRVLESAVPTTAQHFYDEDYSGFEAWSGVDECYGSVAMQYSAYTDIANTRLAVSAENSANWERGIKGDLAIDMLETTDSHALLLAQKYSAILRGPLDYIRVTLPAPALFLEPTDKIYITKSLVDVDGTTRTLYADDVFLVMEIEKDLNAARATIVAVKSRPEFYWSTSAIETGKGAYALTGKAVTLTKTLAPE